MQYRSSGSGPGDRNRPQKDYREPSSFIASSQYLAGGYFDAQGHLRCEILTEQAQRAANELEKASPKLNYSQLRRFFNMIRFIELQLQSKRSFPAVRANIAALVPAAADAVNRGVAPEIFRTFIEKNVRLAQENESSFSLGLIQHFQSVVCYYPRQSGQ